MQPVPPVMKIFDMDLLFKMECADESIPTRSVSEVQPVPRLRFGLRFPATELVTVYTFKIALVV